MSSSSSGSSGGIGFTGVLTIVFIVLKLTHVIAWSWWWVLSPLWIGFALLLAFWAVLGMIFLIVAIIPDRKPRRSARRYSRF